MNLAEKIYQLRKSVNWSQEELAQELNVSRQSVSKWESNQAVPDSEKIIQLSQIFEVSTDYLLKDDLLDAAAVQKGVIPAKRVTFETATTFMDLRQKMAKWYALAVGLFISSPVILILLEEAQKSGLVDISKNTATMIGIIFLLVFVALGVGMIIYANMQLDDYEYLETDDIALDPGIAPLVQEKQQQSRNDYIGKLILAIVLLILSPLSVLVAELLYSNDFITIIGTALLLIVVAIGVSLLILINIPRDSYLMLLEEGDYLPENKKRESSLSPFATIYWLSIILIFLVYSFYYENWSTSWIIWPIAGIVYVILTNIWTLVQHKK